MGTKPQKIAELEIKNIPLTQLVSWNKNPREINKTNFKRLKRDLVEYSMLTPLIVDGRDMRTVLGGNMRLRFDTVLDLFGGRLNINCLRTNKKEMLDDRA